jgi:hypothetical protein
MASACLLLSCWTVGRAAFAWLLHFSDKLKILKIPGASLALSLPLAVAGWWFPVPVPSQGAMDSKQRNTTSGCSGRWTPIDHQENTIHREECDMCESSHHTHGPSLLQRVHIDTPCCYVTFFIIQGSPIFSVTRWSYWALRRGLFVIYLGVGTIR